MSRLSIVAVSLALAAAPGHADSFGGWQYAAPTGYTVETAAHHVSLTRVDGPTFCSIAIFEARSLEGAIAKEAAYEWHNVVTHAFDAKVRRRVAWRTPQGAEVTSTTATLVDREGNRYQAIHHVVRPPGVIGSVLLTSSTPASLRACERVGRQVVRSLAVDWHAPQFYDPEARVETPIGRWAIAGATSREYTFLADGTYRFYRETPGPDREEIVDESGRYKLLGNQLTLVPLQATRTQIADGVTRTARLPLEKVTYTWGKRYSPETNTWVLVMTPRRATARDGALPGAGYRYSDRVKPAWKHKGQPGV